MSRFRNGKSLINQALFLSVGGQPVLLSLAPKNSLKWRIWASQTYPKTKGATVVFLPYLQYRTYGASDSFPSFQNEVSLYNEIDFPILKTNYGYYLHPTL